MEPKNFGLMVKYIRNLEKMVNKYNKKNNQKNNKFYVRKSIVASKKIKKEIYLKKLI